MSKALATGIAGVAVLPLLLAAASRPASANPVANRAARPTLVAVLPEIGSVFVRTNCSVAEQPGQSLGILTDKMGQSGQAAFRIGSHARWRDLEPGHPTVWLPCFTRRIALAAAAGGENGTVVGTALVDFGPRPPRRGYDPPRLTLKLYPRGYYQLGGRFIRKDGRLKPPRG